MFKYLRLISHRVDSLIYSLFLILCLGTIIHLLALMNAVSPLDVYSYVYSIVLTPYGVAQILYRSTVLILLGIAASVCFQAKIFNIALESQFFLACLATAITATYLPEHWPTYLVWILLGLVSIASGMLWAIIPAFLKIKYRASEIVTTLMLNFVAYGLSGLMMKFHAVSETTHTQLLPQKWMFPLLSENFFLLRGSQLNVMFIAAIVAACLMQWFIFRYSFGFKIRCIGDNQIACSVFGVNYHKTLLFSFMISGGCAGFASLNELLGAKGFYEEGFSLGLGFTGIAVSLIARHRPLAVIPSALFFSFLSYSSLAVNSLIPKEAIHIITACIMLVILLQQAEKK